jgi:hypothetical protein
MMAVVVASSSGPHGIIRAATVIAASASQNSEGKRSVRNGVYTEEQANRGKVEWRRCLLCHSDMGEGDPSIGAPPVAGEEFLKNWSTLTLKELFDKISKTMPQDNPGGLTPKQYVDVMSYILQLNKFPEGKEELLPDIAQLDRIIIEKP